MENAWHMCAADCHAHRKRHSKYAIKFNSITNFIHETRDARVCVQVAS